MTCGVSFSCGEILLQLLIIGLSNGAILALNALGVTLVYSIVRTINFAYGDLFSLASVVSASALLGLGVSAAGQHSGIGAALAMLAALALAAGGGAGLNVAIERLAFRPFRAASGTAPLIATIGISFMLYQGALFLRTFTNAVIPGEHRSVPGIPEVPRLRLPELLPETDVLRMLGLRLEVSYPLKDLLLVLFAIAVCLLTHRALARTRAGRALRACAQDPEMAQLCGVNRDGTIRLAFALGGALAGVGAWAFTLYHTHPFTNYGAQSGLLAFTAAILGGVGRPRGALLSGLTLGVLASFSDYFLATQWTPVLSMAVLIALVVLKPAGGQSAEAPAPAVSDSPAPRRQRDGRWLAVGLLILLAAFPLLNHLLDLRFQVGMTKILIFALLALGLNLVLGVAGQLDLGYSAYFAVGAYAMGLLTSPSSKLAALAGGPWQFGLALLASALAAALLAGFSGALTTRLRGDYLAIVTLALGQIVLDLLLNLSSVTNGVRGLSGVPAPTTARLPVSAAIQSYAVVAACVGLAAWGAGNLVRSHLGRAWRALGMDETAAASAGVNPARAKAQALMLGGAIAGVAGGLIASVFGNISPSLAEFHISALTIAMVIIGGGRSMSAAIVGALLVAGYDQLLIPRLGAALESWSKTVPALGLLDIREFNFLAFGLALYLTILIRARRPAAR